MAETEKERSDRQLIELLNELRVALPGAQVLLAFLLTVPFQARFGRTTELQRAVIVVDVVLTAVGVVLLMAPPVYHRIRWNEGGKEDVIQVGHRLFLAGTFCLAVGLLLAVFLIGDVLFGLAAAAVAVVQPLAVVIVIWYALPLRRRGDLRIRREE